MNELFPRTTVGGVSLSRMLIGAIWSLGWSHTSPSADAQIKDTHRTPATIELMLDVALDNCVDSIIGLFNTNPVLNQAISNVEQAEERNSISLTRRFPMQNSLSTKTVRLWVA